MQNDRPLDVCTGFVKIASTPCTTGIFSEGWNPSGLGSVILRDSNEGEKRWRH
jgi:hypothetical protein